MHRLGAALAPPLPASYKRRVWFAVAALVGFIVLYFGLAGWFLYTAYRLLVAAEAAAFSGLVVGAGAIFLAVFMLKPLFFVRRGKLEHLIEVTRRDQPRLFAFLCELADSAEAPRPHRVFVSGQVNAAVFYDLSIRNLLFPSKKNLEIGLPVVNALTFGECRAVLAHEFGHFTQRSMAVLRWSQIAHQIAAHLVARRDKLDALLEGLSRIDVRIAWIGWILSLIVWSIRSLVDTAFHGVVLLQRALSREMEFQADLVAVSLTGSDALIHALYRLQAADDSWDRTLNFVVGEKARKRAPRDIFTLHTQIMARMGDILNNPAYGRVMPVPRDRPAEHRVFSPELGHPPRMWHTHPLNHEREENAKRRYVPMPIDDASAWTLFDDDTALRERISTMVLDVPATDAVGTERSMEALNAEFERPFLDSRYRGLYLNRSVVRGAARADDLFGPPPADWRERLAPDSLYPETLIEEIARLRALQKEVNQLRAIEAGALQPSEGIIRHRGRNVRRKDLAQTIEGVAGEARAVEERLQAADRACRTVHLAAATALGGGWGEYLRGLTRAIHYADHTAANIRDLYVVFSTVLRTATATRRVSSDGMQRVLHAANALYDAQRRVYGDAIAVKLDTTLLQRMALASWSACFEQFKLVPATAQNINSWLGVIDGWVNQTLSVCDALRDAALEQLLLTESALAAHIHAGTTPEPAPAPTTVPAEYDLLLTGVERPRPRQLTWWQRFQLADGVLPSLARFAVAAGIVGIVLGFGGGVGTSTITLYNGLDIPVLVSVAGQRLRVGTDAPEPVEVDPGETFPIVARTIDGRLVDSIDAKIPRSFGNYVFNIAGAGAMYRWTVVYGHGLQQEPPQYLGAPRWRKTDAQYVLVPPPQSIKTSGENASVDALSSMADWSPWRQYNAVAADSERERLLLAHARWDATTSTNIIDWLTIARHALPQYADVLQERLRTQPGDIVLLRMEQDGTEGLEHDAVCARHRQQSLANPNDADLAYLASRCIDEIDARLAAFLAAYHRWPTHPWLAMGVGYGYTAAGRWREAVAPLQQARAARPISAGIAVDLARIHRLLGDSAAVRALARSSDIVQSQLNLERGIGFDSTALYAYEALRRGDLEEAVRRAGSDSDVSVRVIRLAAASDGAWDGLVRQALRLAPTDDMDAFSRWTSIALAVRQGRDYQALLKSETMSQEYVRHLQRFMQLVRRGAPAATAAAELHDLPLAYHALGYTMGVVILGQRAPTAWRQGAQRLLFAWERPYFR